MNRKKRQRAVVAAAGLLLGLLLAPGCEDTPLTAPSDGSIRMVASPQTIVIDTFAGQAEGQSTITAQVFDASSRPMIGANVIFSTAAGTLASGGPPNTVSTDSNGIASDILTLKWQDPDSVSVTATSGSLSESTPVSLTLNTSGEVVAKLAASPVDRQGSDMPVTFDGRTSVALIGSITCYQFQVVAPNPMDTFTEQNTTGTITHSFSTMTFPYQPVVTLFVANDPNASQWCTATPAPVTNFVSKTSLTYDIACSLVAPTARASVNVRAGNLGGWQATLTSSGSDGGDSTITDYFWECPNAEAGDPDPADQAQVNCDYSMAGDYEATLTITTDCGDTAMDTVFFSVP